MMVGTMDQFIVLKSPANC